MENAQPPRFAEGSLAHALRDRFDRGQHPLLVGVAGDSGSGKTTYTEGIEWLLGADLVSQISLDGYHKEDRATRRQSGASPLDPDANHLAQAAADLAQLQQGIAVDIPRYDHRQGQFLPPRRHTPTPVILIEGLHTLYPEFQSLLDFRIFVDSDVRVKREWKFTRDTEERGYADTEAESQIASRADEFEKWLADQQYAADVVVRIHPSTLGTLALDGVEDDCNDTCYHIEVIVTPNQLSQGSLYFPVDLSTMTRQEALPFMLAMIPSRFQGHGVNVLHVDGHMPLAALDTLENEIRQFIGKPAAPATTTASQALPPTIRFAQMLVAWPFLGHLATPTNAV